ncbi:hypothetical protein AB0I10_35665 [Streptomyces sp. NPDC050636]|uniref:hypothetical protein n=1 Tax=Streptomyces sp. NPDC050636 TaxID=3154510 RepID=UPI00343ACD63
MESSKTLERHAHPRHEPFWAWRPHLGILDRETRATVLVADTDGFADRGTEAVAPFSWIFGMLVAGVLHALVSGRGRVVADAGPIPESVIPSQVRRVVERETVLPEGTGVVVAPVPAKGS